MDRTPPARTLFAGMARAHSDPESVDEAQLPPAGSWVHVGATAVLASEDVHDPFAGTALLWNGADEDALVVLYGTVLVTSMRSSWPDDVGCTTVYHPDLPPIVDLPLHFPDARVEQAFSGYHTDDGFHRLHIKYNVQDGSVVVLLRVNAVETRPAAASEPSSGCRCDSSTSDSA